MQQTTQYYLAEDVDKQYKNGVQALSGLSLSVKRGEISPCWEMVREVNLDTDIDYLSQTGQRKDIRRAGPSQDAEKYARIACVSQQTSIDTHLSLKNMMFQSRLYRIPKAAAQNVWTNSYTLLT